MEVYFIRPEKACKCLYLLGFCVVVLAGCAARGPAPPLPDGEFELRGKISVADGDQRFSARFLWQQHRDRLDLELWGPLGQGRVRLQGDAEHVAIIDAAGEVVSAGAPDAVMREHLGWTLPLTALVHWGRGMPSPRLPVREERRDASGRLLAFEQLGWSVTCQDHQALEDDAPFAWLPTRIIAERPGYRVAMVLSQWRL